jgi:phosphatidylglycerophosphate synthase
MKNTILAILAIFIYLQVRIMNCLLIWKGQPMLQVWVTEKQMVQRDTIYLIFAHIELWGFLLLDWIGWLIFLACHVVLITIYAVVVMTVSMRKLKESGYEKTN